MPIFQLIDELIFPPVELAEAEGMLAIGGDLSPERLLLAYQSGIFPWYMEESPILWWSPDPRFVLFPSELKIPKSMNRVFNKQIFAFTFDQRFEEVITSCSFPRKKEKGTWLVPDMIDAYIRLHKLGYAHSVESWYEGKLAGGLYGVSMGRCFFGESMFTRINNASKAALIFLTKKLKELGFIIIDSQIHTPHLERIGAREIPREQYLQYLKKGLKFKTLKGSWQNLTGSRGN